MSTPETTLRPVAVMVCELLDDPHFRALLLRELRIRGGAPRVEQLALAIESWSVERAEAVPAVLPAAASAREERRATTSSQPKRVLVIAGDEPEAVLLRSYAERLAWAMAAAGHSVVIARARRGRLPVAPARDHEPTILELEAGPLPVGTTLENHRLSVAGPFHRRLERLMREHGPFDVLLAEGTLGHLSGPPLAKQFGLPLLIALDGCEVSRRKNQLSRDQLYMAELEHWACDRALVVVASSPVVEGALREHYKLVATLVVAPPQDGLRAPFAGDAARLLRQLTIEAPFVLVLGCDAGDEARRALLEAAPGRTVVFAERGLWLARADGAVARVHDRPVVGPALGALLVSAEVVVATVDDDLRLHEARLLAQRLGSVRIGGRLAQTLLDARPAQPAVDATPGLLEGLLANLTGSTSGWTKEAQVAHGLR